MIMNVLNVSSDTYILQIIIQGKIRKADKKFAKIFGFKDMKFPVKIRDIHKIERKKKELYWYHCFWFLVLVIKTKKSIQSKGQKILSKDMFIHY